MPRSREGDSRTPQFFCESCGVEVPRDAESCPKCAKRFSSVRCPACDFIGEVAIFKDGCPVCDYTPGAPVKTRPARGKSAANTRRGPSKKPVDPLPLWVYILTAVAFTGVLAALFFSFF